MKTVELKAFTVAGLKVRTNNADEMEADKAKIGLLWQGFNDKLAPKLGGSAKVYGVYCNYESDASGEFDVYAASDAFTEQDGFESKTIQAGEYMVFSGKGEMPQAVIDTWISVWDYFSKSPARARAYTTDFELYKSQDEVEIYIALE